MGLNESWEHSEISAKSGNKKRDPDHDADGYLFTVASEGDVGEAAMLAKAVWESKRDKQG